MLAVLAVTATSYWLLPLVAWGLARALAFALNASVWLAVSLSSGAGARDIVTTVARAAAGAVATPEALGGLATLVIVGALALVGLLRLLESEEDSAP